MRREILIIIGVAIIAVGIGALIFLFGGGDALNTRIATPDTNNSVSAVVVPFTEIRRGPQSTIEKRVNYFITSHNQFGELWKIINATGTPPTIDFKTHSVVAVFAGEVPTSGYDIAVVKVEDADKRVVNIELIKPDESCVLAQSLTTPYQVIELPKTSLPFTHADTWTTKSCR